MSLRRRYTRYWILTGAVGLMIFHPFSAQLPPVVPDAVPSSTLPAESVSKKLSTESKPVTQERGLKEREPVSKAKKVFQILSRFKTGLDAKQEERLAGFIAQESRRYGFDPELIVAVISTESSFYNWSISSKGAVGLMQMIPTTAKEIAEVNHLLWHEGDPLFDPFINIRLGIHYLWTLYLKFGDLSLALTAYNHGPGKVLRWVKTGDEIPTEYAEKVLAYYQDFLEFGKEKREETVKVAETQVALRS
ncbi:MAG: lytic transglycosylase domain-containing protein [Nitrospirae bacterium]|nr:lytic transglycosylase domain-containing protein [Candidatus Manganitrophaceae bacterium]